MLPGAARIEPTTRLRQQAAEKSAAKGGRTIPLFLPTREAGRRGLDERTGSLVYV
jgi:hypothetical protein